MDGCVDGCVDVGGRGGDVVLNESDFFLIYREGLLSAVYYTVYTV